MYSCQMQFKYLNQDLEKIGNFWARLVWIQFSVLCPCACGDLSSWRCAFGVIHRPLPRVALRETLRPRQPAAPTLWEGPALGRRGGPSQVALSWAARLITRIALRKAPPAAAHGSAARSTRHP